MTALIIILIILAVLFSLLLFPLKIIADLTDTSAITLKYLFFTIPLKTNKGKGKKKKENKKKEEKAEDKESIKFKEILEYGEIIKDALKKLSEVLKHLKSDIIKIDIKVSGEDAAKTAIYYGAVCSAVYPAVSFIQTKIEVKKTEINISPDFDSTKTKGSFYGKFRIMPLHLIAAVISLVKYFITIKNTD